MTSREAAKHWADSMEKAGYNDEDIELLAGGLVALKDSFSMARPGLKKEGKLKLMKGMLLIIQHVLANADSMTDDEVAELKKTLEGMGFDMNGGE